VIRAQQGEAGLGHLKGQLVVQLVANVDRPPQRCRVFLELYAALDHAIDLALIRPRRHGHGLPLLVRLLGLTLQGLGGGFQPVRFRDGLQELPLSVLVLLDVGLKLIRHRAKAFWELLDFNFDAHGFFPLGCYRPTPIFWGGMW
jgi:hypothetical protein